MTIRTPETRNPRPNMSPHESRSHWRQRSQQMEQERNAALGQMLDNSYAPDANCSCHISPPCHDCVDNGGLREAIDYAKAALAAAKGAAHETG